MTRQLPPSREAAEHARYVEQMGKAPPAAFPDGTPAAWQWRYRGRREERDVLRARLAIRPGR